MSQHVCTGPVPNFKALRCNSPDKRCGPRNHNTILVRPENPRRLSRFYFLAQMQSCDSRPCCTAQPARTPATSVTLLESARHFGRTPTSWQIPDPVKIFLVIDASNIRKTYRGAHHLTKFLKTLTLKIQNKMLLNHLVEHHLQCNMNTVQERRETIVNL